MYIEEEWLQVIQNDIQKKYSIAQPIFYVDTVEMSGDALNRWICLQLSSFDGAIIQYKYLEGKNFELNFYIIDPPPTICKSIIDTYLKNLPATTLERRFTLSYKDRCGDEIVGTTEYTEEEVRHKLFDVTRSGQSNLSFYKEPTTRKDKVVYHIWTRPESLPNMLQTGYLELEHKNIL